MVQHIFIACALSSMKKISLQKKRLCFPYRSKTEKPHRTGILGWEKTKVLAYNYVGWNMRRPLFKDAKVRRAMGHVFPRQRLIDEVYSNLGKPINSNVHPDTPYANLNLPEISFDLQKQLIY